MSVHGRIDCFKKESTKRVKKYYVFSIPGKFGKCFYDKLIVNYIFRLFLNKIDISNCGNMITFENGKFGNYITTNLFNALDRTSLL